MSTPLTGDSEDCNITNAKLVKIGNSSLFPIKIVFTAIE